MGVKETRPHVSRRVPDVTDLLTTTHPMGRMLVTTVECPKNDQSARELSSKNGEFAHIALFAQPRPGRGENCLTRTFRACVKRSRLAR
jgi:hypothetical protein